MVCCLVDVRVGLLAGRSVLCDFGFRHAIAPGRRGKLTPILPNRSLDPILDPQHHGGPYHEEDHDELDAPSGRGRGDGRFKDQHNDREPDECHDAVRGVECRWRAGHATREGLEGRSIASRIRRWSMVTRDSRTGRPVLVYVERTHPTR